MECSAMDTDSIAKGQISKRSFVVYAAKKQNAELMKEYKTTRGRVS
jgi:hypothetical protein